MSRPHCARSFPSKLSISEPLDFEFFVSLCRFSAWACLVYCRVLFSFFYIFGSFFLIFSVPFFLLLSYTHYTHSRTESFLFFLYTVSCIYTIYSVCHDRNCSGSVTRNVLRVLFLAPTNVQRLLTACAVTLASLFRFSCKSKDEWPKAAPVSRISVDIYAHVRLTYSIWMTAFFHWHICVGS